MESAKMAVAHCHSGTMPVVWKSGRWSVRVTTFSESIISSQTTLFGIVHAAATDVTMKNLRDRSVLIVGNGSGMLQALEVLTKRSITYENESETRIGIVHHFRPESARGGRPKLQ
jgi:hypothetical protein